MRSVCVIGLGLVGGSVLRAARAAGRPSWGTTKSSGDAAAASAAGYRVMTHADALSEAVATGAIVVLAVPLPEVDAVLRTLPEDMDAATITDVVSVKAPVADAAARLAPQVRYVAGHPMAGTQSSGWGAGDADLFRGRSWALCPPEPPVEAGYQDAVVDLTAWRDVAMLALDFGAHVVPVTAADHDAAVARVSHLPHVLAAVLASVAADAGPLPFALAAGSLMDGTRVAATRPELTAAMCEGNGRALLPVIDDALGRLGTARGSLASTGSLTATLRQGHEARTAFDAWQQRPTTRLHVNLTAPDAVSALLGIGDQGGRIVAVDAATNTATAVVPRDC